MRASGMAAPTLLSACATTTSAGREGKRDTVRVVREEAMILASDPGIQLYVRNKHPEGTATFAPERILLFVHGQCVAPMGSLQMMFRFNVSVGLVRKHGHSVSGIRFDRINVPILRIVGLEARVHVHRVLLADPVPRRLHPRIVLRQPRVDHALQPRVRHRPV